MPDDSAPSYPSGQEAPQAGPSWQAREDLLLAPYAASASRSQGRPRFEIEHAYRGPYERDRDRIVHTNAFRRLEYKTQVFVNHEGDHYRTRLTHTIEVSLIARTLARALRLNEDLAEAIALAHDLGHPPFGHSGEAVLDTLMREQGGFEHNVQSLRIVDRLEVRYPGFRGLNLTEEVREGLRKRTWFRPSGTGATLEAQLCDQADSITYDSHDVDDGLRSGLLDRREIEQLAIWRRVGGVVRDRGAENGNGRSGANGLAWAGPARPDAGQASAVTRAFAASDDLEIARHVRGLIDQVVSDVLRQTSANLRDQRVETYDDLRAAGPLAAFSPEVAAERRELEAFLRQRLYQHPRLTEARRAADEVIVDLFTAYRANPDLISAATRRRQGDESTDRLICDYVAGMTDRFALAEHSRLFGQAEAASRLAKLLASR